MTNEPQQRDLDSRENIEAFVDLFYRRILEDEQLSPIFLDVAGIDLAVHLPHIKNYWCKLLLGEKNYQRHTMNIHRQLHGKQPLQSGDFQRWLALENRAGPGAAGNRTLLDRPRHGNSTRGSAGPAALRRYCLHHY